MALDDTRSPGSEWRIHFHVPLFAREYAAFASTQDYVRRVLAAAAQNPFTTHLEIETYTWGVLPPGLKMDLGESIAREYEWVLATIDEVAELGASDGPSSGSRSSNTRSSNTRSSDTRSSK